MAAGGVVVVFILVLPFIVMRAMRYRRYEKTMDRRREMREQYKRRSQFRGRQDVELDQGPRRPGTRGGPG
jgi:hypothetical protein